MGAKKALKNWAAILLALFCIPLPLSFSFPAKAAATGGFSAALSSPEGELKDRVELAVSYGGEGKLGAFLLRVEYDSAVLEYSRAEEGELLEDGSLTLLPDETGVSACCVMQESAVQEGTALTLQFQVREDAPAGETVIHVSVFQAADLEGSPLEGAELPLAFSVLPPPSTEATLTALQPTVGELVPAFSPELFDYTMSVPFSVTSLEFTAEAAEGAVYRVNRKNLGAGGSDTDFLFTVTAADGKTKSTYKVTVYREEKPTPSPKPTPTPKPTPKPTASSSQADGQAATRTPTPKKSPTPSPEATRKPSPAPTSTPASNVVTYQGGGVQPSVVIYNSNPSAGPIVAAIAIMTAAFLLSGPLAHFLSRKFRKKKKTARDEKSPDKEDSHKV